MAAAGVYWHGQASPSSRLAALRRNNLRNYPPHRLRRLPPSPHRHLMLRRMRQRPLPHHRLRKMPPELALLPVVESAFNPTALSRAKASGLWQFIPATGKRFGLKQNNYYDGRRDIVESTRAALDYFDFLAQEFDGDWYLAIAAY